MSDQAERPKACRGFAAMDPEKQREIASRGGRAAHARGRAHTFTSETAREAGRRGGKSAHRKGTAHKFTSAEAREAGRNGGRGRGVVVAPVTVAVAEAPE
jgi:general stress protein YciG